MSADRVAKLRRLGALRRSLPRMSQTAFHAVLKAAEKEPLPTIGHRGDVAEARELTVDQDTPYGTVHQKLRLQKSDGTEWCLEVQHPYAMLHVLAMERETVQKALRRLVRQFACTQEDPLGLIIYNDEVTPGRSLAHQNLRKMYNVYWTLGEWYPHICLEDFWFHSLVARSSEVKGVDGGISYIMRELLKQCFSTEPLTMGRSQVSTCN